MNNKILVIDDDPKICELLSDILKENNMQVSVAETTEQGWDKVMQFDPDIILLDVEVPLKGGLEFCRELKETKSYQQIPIIFLTVRGQDIDKVSAFSLGGDDFMTKPFSQKELLARIHVALRRSSLSKMQNSVLKSGSLYIDFDRRIVLINNKEIKLTPKEFDMLKLLYINRHRVVNDRELFDQIWGASNTSLMSTVYTHMNRVRTKLKEHGVKIRTIAGVGFRFDERKDLSERKK